MTHPTVVCPVDFSQASRGALRYASAVAEHFGATLVLVTVNDPLLTDAGDLQRGLGWLRGESERELKRFFVHAFDHAEPPGLHVEFEVASGKPGPEILRIAHERTCDLIVMSAHGVTGFRKLFFGSTTERVLRETHVPMLVVPAADTGPPSAVDVRRSLRRVLVPVNLSSSIDLQVDVARKLAEGLGVSLLLTHVVEPVRFPASARPMLPNVDVERRALAEQALEAHVASLPPAIKPEALVVFGDPAEEIAKVAHDRNVGLIVMGLHAPTATGPRMGSVTYRVLCLAPRLVLALPPVAPASARERWQTRTSLDADITTSTP